MCAFKLIAFSRQSSAFVYGWQASLSFFFIQTMHKQIYVAKKLLCRNCLRKMLSQRSYLITKCNQKIFRFLVVVTCDRDRMLLLFLMLIISIIIFVITTHSIKIATDTLHIPSIIAFLTSASLKRKCTFVYDVRAQNIWWHRMWSLYMTRLDLQDN